MDKTSIIPNHVSDNFVFDKDTGWRLDLPSYIEPGTKVLCLYRVSTDKQLYHTDNNEADIPMQRKRCRKYCESMDWTIVCELQEEGVSGHKVRAENRDKVQLIKEYAKQKSPSWRGISFVGIAAPDFVSPPAVRADGGQMERMRSVCVTPARQKAALMGIVMGRRATRYPDRLRQRCGRGCEKRYCGCRAAGHCGDHTGRGACREGTWYPGPCRTLSWEAFLTGSACSLWRLPVAVSVRYGPARLKKRPSP